jgi:hypothetical protein
MQALLSGKLNIFVFMLFFVLILSGLIIQHLVKTMRWEIMKEEYEAERGPVEEAPKLPPPEEVLPGYTMLTYTDYEEMKLQVLQEMAQQKEGGTDAVRTPEPKDGL